MSVDGGERVASSISSYIATNGSSYDVIVVTRDWHIDPGSHFSSEPDFVDTWPPHCVANTAGASFHPNLNKACDVTALAVCISKGAYEAAYSGFEGTDEHGASLHELLRSRRIAAVDIVGLATDYCDKATALDAMKLGYEVRLLTSMCAGVSPETTRIAMDEMSSSGVVMV